MQWKIPIRQFVNSWIRKFQKPLRYGSFAAVAVTAS